MRITASLVCADGRQAVLAHMIMSVPQGNETVMFSRPDPGTDPYSAWWQTFNPCSSLQQETLEVNLRNITTTHFIATTKSSGRPESRTASEHQKVVTHLGDEATLTLHSEVLSTALYPTSAEASKAAHAVAAEYDGTPEVPSKFGGIGPAMSWAAAYGDQCH